MADQPNAFSESTTTPNSEPNSLDALLANIKNENGEQKYKSLEDALKALDASQRYIPELKNQLTGAINEVEGLKTQVSKFSNIEETVQRLLAQDQNRGSDPPPVAGLDEQAVIKLVQQSLQSAKAADVAESNFKLVNEALVKKYGDKAVETVTSKAAELGTTPKALQELASQNPQLVLALFGSTTHSDPTMTHTSRQAPPPVKVEQEAAAPRRGIFHANDRDRAAYLRDLRAEIYAKVEKEGLR